MFRKKIFFFFFLTTKICTRPCLHFIFKSKVKREIKVIFQRITVTFLQFILSLVYCQMKHRLVSTKEWVDSVTVFFFSPLHVVFYSFFIGQLLSLSLENTPWLFWQIWYLKLNWQLAAL